MSTSWSSLAFAQAESPPEAASPAQTSSSSTAAEVDLDALGNELREQLKQELREQLRDELKEEIKAELAEESAMEVPAQADQAWAEEEWKWEEPVKPELNFLEFDGYFRFRYDMFNGLDLGLYYLNRDPASGQPTETGPFAQQFRQNAADPTAAGSWQRVQAPPVPTCNTSATCVFGGVDENGNPVDAAGESNTLGGANMRLRLEPTLNVSEDVKVKMQIDVLDNVILGSQADSLPYNPLSPVSALSQTQIAPSDGFNAIWGDSIRVKRAWAEIMTPLGQIQVGRMPNHFGMGLLANDGNALDQDFGDTADRLMFVVPDLFGHRVAPAFDWAASGPTSATRFQPYGQPFDRDNRDDADRFVLFVTKEDNEETITRKLDNDEWVLNYGTFQSLTLQPIDAASFYAGGSAEDQIDDNRLVDRDATVYNYSYWLRFKWRKLHVEAEYSGLIGSIDNPIPSGDFTTSEPEIDLNQHALAVNVEYKTLSDALTLRLLVLSATGDAAPGWGLRPLMPTDGQTHPWDGDQTVDDGTLSNFRVDPSFYVDLIFWRQLVGQITDALIIRPGAQYNLTKGLGARLDLVYSRAWFTASTPSGSFNTELGDPDNSLGIETDFKLFYDDDDGFHAWLEYGLFIPLSGLNRQLNVEGTNSEFGHRADQVINGQNPADFQIGRLDAGVAHTVQVFLGVSF